MQNDFKLIRSDRKTIAIQILPDLSVLVRAPRHMPIGKIQKFVAQKEHWISTSRLRIQALAANEPKDKLTKDEIAVLKQQAVADLTARAEYYAKRVGIGFKKLTVRCQTSRWGSCSGKGNLSFNCLLMLTPADVRNYVVVHELCHRQHMNHSPAFWASVESILPEYRQAKLWLKDNGYSLIARIK